MMISKKTTLPCLFLVLLVLLTTSTTFFGGVVKGQEDAYDEDAYDEQEPPEDDPVDPDFVDEPEDAYDDQEPPEDAYDNLPDEPEDQEPPEDAYDVEPDEPEGQEPPEDAYDLPEETETETTPSASAPSTTDSLVVNYDCDACIFRKLYKLQAFTTQQEIQDSFVETATNNIGIPVTDPDVVYARGDIAQAIQDAAASGADAPDVMMVSVRGADVASAMDDASNNQGIATIGLDAASLLKKERAGMISAVGFDDKALGTAAFGPLQSSWDEWMAEQDGPGGPGGPGGDSLDTAVFVSVPINGQVPKRTDDAQEGFEDAAEESGVDVTTIFYDNNANSTSTEPLFEGCPGEAVLVSHPLAVDDVIATLSSNSCLAVVGVILPKSSESYGMSEVESMIVRDSNSVDVAVSQQVGNQGRIGAIMASLYATTGLALAESDADEADEDGRYLLEPIVYTRECIDADNCLGVKGATTEPATVKLGGVLHGQVDDEFWDPVYAAANQAAADANVELDLERFDSVSEGEEGATELAALMSAKIDALCNNSEEGGEPLVHGLFVSLPTSDVLMSVQSCLSKGVPVVVVNAGYWFATNSFETAPPLNYVGQREAQSGRGAGQRLAKACRGCAFFCLNHAPGTASLATRCSAFQEAVTNALDSNTYPVEPFVEVDPTNITQYILDVEAAVATSSAVRSDEWNRVAILAVGAQESEALAALKDKHSGVSIGMFDLSDGLYQGLKEDKFLFGIDQQPYLQGYWPVALLTTYIETGQKLGPFVIQTGPTLVEEAPSEAEQFCINNNYEVCSSDYTVPPAPVPAPVPSQPTDTTPTSDAVDPAPMTPADDTDGAPQPPTSTDETGGDEDGAAATPAPTTTSGASLLMFRGVSSLLVFALVFIL